MNATMVRHGVRQGFWHLTSDRTPAHWRTAIALSAGQLLQFFALKFTSVATVAILGSLEVLFSAALVLLSADVKPLRSKTLAGVGLCGARYRTSCCWLSWVSGNRYIYFRRNKYFARPRFSRLNEEDRNPLPLSEGLHAGETHDSTSHIEALQFQEWSEENADKLRPPVGNQLLHKEGDMIVMVVGGPQHACRFS